MRWSRDAWEPYVDALLQREAVLCRANDGLSPRDFAGMYVDHADVDRILRQLPGLNGPHRSEADDLYRLLDPVVDRTREEFWRWLRASDDDEGGTSISPMRRLLRTQAFSDMEVETFVLVAAIDRSPDRQRLAVYLQDNVNQSRPSIDLVRRILGNDDGLRPESHLRQGCLIELVGEGPWSSRMAALPDRIGWYLAGSDRRDPDLPPRAKVVSGTAVVESTADGSKQPIRFVIGADTTARRRVAADDGCGLLITPLPDTDQAWDAVVRESLLRNLRPCLEIGSDLPMAAASRLEQHQSVDWVVSAPSELRLDHLPDVPWTEQRVATRPERHSEDHERLVEAAQQALGGDRSAAVRRLARGHLDGLATRIPPRRGWDDLVVHADQLEQLRDLADRHRHADRVYGEWEFRAVPSSGLVAVFAGPSGTGKTLSAEVIATDLGLDLYKIDLSSVVSKYIGETEKNLEQIFHAASSGSVVLFFDEADALFGKRSEVGDAHDRYANIEVSYLLQRLEAYDGLVILATNLQNNMDQAFLRRIHVAVDFTLPDEDERRAIWELSFPSAAPAGELDFEFLARQFKVSGGTIRNAALGAAFMAASTESPIGMPEVVRSLSREFNKLGRLRTPEEFDRYFDLISRPSGSPPPAFVR